eukprot:12429916-Karenia_brevis.AAC.1
MSTLVQGGWAAMGQKNRFAVLLMIRLIWASLRTVDGNGKRIRFYSSISRNKVRIPSASTVWGLWDIF